MNKSTIPQIIDEFNKHVKEVDSKCHVPIDTGKFIERNIAFLKKVMKACLSSDSVTIFLISVLASIFALCLRLGKFVALLILSGSSPNKANYKVIEAYRDSLEGMGFIPDIFLGILVIVLICIIITNSQANINKFRRRRFGLPSEKKGTLNETPVSPKLKFFSLFQSIMFGLCLISLDLSAAEDISLLVIMTASLLIYEFRMWCANYRNTIIFLKPRRYLKKEVKLPACAWYVIVDIVVVLLIYLIHDFLVGVCVPNIFIVPLTILLILYLLSVLWAFLWMIFEGLACLEICIRKDSDSSKIGHLKVDKDKNDVRKAHSDKTENNQTFQAWLCSLWWIPVLVLFCITLYGFALNLCVISLSRIPF